MWLSWASCESPAWPFTSPDCCHEQILSQRDAFGTSPLPVSLVCRESVIFFDPSLFYATSCQAWTVRPWVPPGLPWTGLLLVSILLNVSVGIIAEFVLVSFNKGSKYFKHNPFFKEFVVHWLFLLILGFETVRLSSFWDVQVKTYSPQNIQQVTFVNTCVFGMMQC